MLHIHDEHCVHRLAVAARCRACVDACPRAAWEWSAAEGSEGLAFDPERCDGCGLCVAQCPTSALALDEPPRVWRLGAAAPAAGRAAVTVSLACTRGPGVKLGDANVVPCVHAIADAQLTAWAAQGVQAVDVTTGDCATCERGRRVQSHALPTLTQRLAWLAQVLRARGKAAPTPRRVEVWQAPPPPGPARAQAAAPVAPSSRRALFGLAPPRPQPAREPGAPPTRQDATRRLHALGDDGPARWGIGIAPERCDACGACARLCPADALALQGTAAQPQALGLHMARCIGCGLCVDVCEPAALRAAAPASVHAAPYRVAFTATPCALCGKPVWRGGGAAGPGAGDDGGGHREITAPAAAQRALAPRCPACRSWAARRGNRIVQADASPPARGADA